MKISVVGAGNAGCFTALHFGYYTRNEKNIEVELIYNPDIPPVAYGQASMPTQLLLLGDSMGFDWYNNFVHAIPKSGIVYEGFGKKNYEWFHPYPRSVVAMHFCPSETQESILQSGYFTVKEGDVDPLDVDSDFVIDCRGTPNNFDNYEELNNPTNACILARPNWDTNVIWSRHVATPDGWAFVIPTKEDAPSRDGSVGYCYNKDITTPQEAEKNMLEMFDVDVIKHTTYKNYVAKNPVVDNRVFLNGNKLYFLEPMESNAVETYIMWSKYIFDFLNGKKTIEQSSDAIRHYIEGVQNFILWHYQFGSIYNTPFWNYAKELTFEDQEFDDTLANIYTRGDEKHLAYSQWGKWSFRNWHKGMVL